MLYKIFLRQNTVHKIIQTDEKISCRVSVCHRIEPFGMKMCQALAAEVDKCKDVKVDTNERYHKKQPGIPEKKEFVCQESVNQIDSQRGSESNGKREDRKREHASKGFKYFIGFCKKEIKLDSLDIFPEVFKMHILKKGEKYEKKIERQACGTLPENRDKQQEKKQFFKKFQQRDMK